MTYPIVDVLQGSDVQLQALVKVSKEGAAINLTGAEAKCVLKRSLKDADSSALLFKSSEVDGGIVFTDAAAGKLVVTLKGSDLETISVEDRTRVFCQIAIKLASGQMARSMVFYIRLTQGTFVSFADAAGDDAIEQPIADSATITAVEALNAGDFVNIFDSNGAAARKANAALVGREAHGYVLKTVLLGGAATVFFDGANDALTGVTAGVAYLSATVPGGFTSDAPSTSGHVVQRIGLGISPTTINFEAHTPTALA